MTGHNHYSDCLCGWCVNQPGRTRSSETLYTNSARTTPFTSYGSFTVPNASCPVCGANVFFYQSMNGGRVFFDELGPPWPKHPCTDNSTLNVGKPALSPTTEARQTEWEKEGWEPVLIKSSWLDRNWHVIPVQNLKTGMFYDALAETNLQVIGDVPALMLPWNSRGWSVISYITLDPEVVIHEVSVFERKRHFLNSKAASVSERQNAK